MSTFERRVMYDPDRVIVATPDVYRLPYEQASIQTSDGKKIDAWFIPEANPHSRVILLCHGNAGNISYRLEKASMLHSAGLSVLLFDYRGYGRSEGVPS